ncbi:GDP-mannose mannosyl hydrolase [Cupriavidus basilensis]|uniref:GDP-mannose mannosyl hydrolase n=1 Tax=Cupriavidus basilensis TaxID=68895 RepID=A0A643FYP5_9BURK|nr:GDP-mannose mannosyl hydrolase [Cupriavidus basilensis]QOT80469.1 GDP-mannose mannosyl hydrolase [Cupriavidus basilensis]
MLAKPDFLSVVANTPLVSIDLLVTDAQGRVLLGRRRNRPAQGSWFVPGGRIRKDESLDAAFRRIVADELGLTGVERGDAAPRGVFEHHYPDNFAAAPGISTHYVVLAYAWTMPDAAPLGQPDQHSEYCWMTPAELLAHGEVHENTRAYFR